MPFSPFSPRLAVGVSPPGIVLGIEFLVRWERIAKHFFLIPEIKPGLDAAGGSIDATSDSGIIET